MAAQQLFWLPSIMFCCKCLDLLSSFLFCCLISEDTFGRLSANFAPCFVVNEIYQIYQNSGDQKTSEFQFFCNLIANISRTQQDVVEQKTSLLTAITLTDAYLI